MTHRNRKPCTRPSPDCRGPYERQIAAIGAIPDDALLPISVDIPAAVQSVLGALPRMRSMRGQVESLGLPSCSPAAIDEVNDGRNRQPSSTKCGRAWRRTAARPSQPLGSLFRTPNPESRNRKPN